MNNNKFNWGRNCLGQTAIKYHADYKKEDAISEDLKVMFYAWSAIYFYKIEIFNNSFIYVLSISLLDIFFRKKMMD